MTENNNSTKKYKMDNKLPFIVPENYFENFALQMDSLIVNQPKTFILRKRRTWLYAAAVFLGLVVFGSSYYYKNLRDTENYESYVLSQVDESSIIDYYVDNK